MSARLLRSTLAVYAGTLLVVCVCSAATPQQLKLTGSIAGLVSDGTGMPQMGATVLLYNRFEKLIERALTDDKGAFQFQALSPDVYAVRVTLASFLPALKRNIGVQPGMQSLLNVNLASVFSSVQLVAVLPGNPLMSDDWKWVLRGSSSTRPILRFGPDLLGNTNTAHKSEVAMFSDTRGLVKVSAGDQGNASLLGNEPDLGTAFALATSFLGKNQFQFSGNIGYVSSSGIPTAAFGTSFRREIAGGMTPELRVTMRQLFLPARAGIASEESAPVLRSVSASFLDHAQLGDHLRLDYGASMESVTYLERLNYFSPFGRLTYDHGNDTVQVSFASGMPPVEFLVNGGETDLDLQRDLTALAQFPRVSLRGGAAQVQRVQSVEAGYRKTMGSRSISVAAYSESTDNAAITMMGGDGSQFSGDLLPDLFSNSWVVNAGSYHSVGYSAVFTQDLGSQWQVGVGYGSGGALTEPTRDAVVSGEPQFQSARRHTVTTRVSGVLPRTGTVFTTSYEWASVPGLTPEHLYLTQRMREGVGLNIRVRQPIPYFGGLPGRLEATADLQNLMAEGYVPLETPSGRILLMSAPRSLRGGLSFIF